MKVEILISLSPLNLQLGSKTPNSTPTAFSCVLMLHVQSPDQWVSMTAAPQLVWTFSWLCISVVSYDCQEKVMQTKEGSIENRKGYRKYNIKKEKCAPKCPLSEYGSWLES